MRVLGGRRRLGSALYSVKQKLFAAKPLCGQRRVLVVVNGGESVDRVRKPAQTLEGAGVEIFVVGVGGVGSRTASQIVTDRAHLFMVGFARLNTIIKTLKDRICYSPGRSCEQRTFYLVETIILQSLHANLSAINHKKRELVLIQF